MCETAGTPRTRKRAHKAEPALQRCPRVQSVSARAVQN